MYNERIIDVLSRSIPLLKEPSEVNFEEDLFQIGLDSLTIIDLVVGLEAEFDIKINDDQLKAEAFKNVNSINEFILSMISGNESE